VIGYALTVYRGSGTEAPDVSFGVLAAHPLETRQLDGAWANTLGSETAECREVGKILVNVRRGDGSSAARHYTFGVLVTVEALIARDPAQMAAVGR
jgi:NitT/TauT family transport system substrate-binding protein